MSPDVLAFKVLTSPDIPTFNVFTTQKTLKWVNMTHFNVFCVVNIKVSQYDTLGLKWHTSVPSVSSHGQTTKKQKQKQHTDWLQCFMWSDFFELESMNISGRLSYSIFYIFIASPILWKITIGRSWFLFSVS